MSEWVEMPLSQLVTFQKGRKVDTSAFPQEGYEAYLGASGIGGISDGFASTRFAVIAKPDDILMLWDGERSGLVGFGRQGVVASTVSRLTPNNKVVPKYLYFALADSFDWIQHRRTGTGVPHVPKDIARILKLRIPKSTAIQQKISAILSTIDEAIEQTEALIAKYQKIKAGLMHNLFTRGVLPNGQLRPPREQAPELYRETVIGWIPREWDLLVLSDASDWFSGGTPNKAREDWWQGDLPWLSPKDMKSFFLNDTQLHLTRQAALWGSRIMAKNTVFIVVRGMILAHSFPVVLSGADFSFNQDIKAVIGRKGVSNRFLAYWFVANTDAILKKTTESTHGTKRFDLKDLCSMQIGIPSDVEQQHIIDRLDTLEDKIDMEALREEKLKLQKLGLMQDLLTGKVAVGGYKPQMETA